MTKKPIIKSETKKRAVKKTSKIKKDTTRIKKKKSKKLKVSIKKVSILSILSLFTALFIFVLYCIMSMPNMDKAISQTRQPMTTIIAENGNEIDTKGNIYSDVVMLYDVHPYVIDAIISTEDRRFYSHFGFDIIAFIRAMSVNIVAGRYAQGGSTITQQVAKNLFLTQNKTIKRKVQELLLSFWLEYKLSKDQILTLYINRVYFGSGTYGIQSASRKYFQKDAADLNLKEAAILAGMLKAPSRYNPLSNTELAIKRAEVVLKSMVDNQAIDKDQYEHALKMNIGNSDKNTVRDAKHFADWVYQETNRVLGERENDVLVYTTLDQELQEKIQKILEKHINNNKSKRVTQGAIVVLENDGAVKAMVGGIDYNKSQFNRATQALRQPGSTFKTFVYLTALQEGFKPNNKINDIPVRIDGWNPSNMGDIYHGEVTLNEAFVRSLNLATIDLMRKLSFDKVIKTAKNLGITTNMNKNYALALGTSEVKVIDMAAAYATIANDGTSVTPYTIKEVYTKEGYQIYQKDEYHGTKVAKRKAIEQIKTMLEKVVDKGTGKKAKIEGNYVAGKTGTSQDYKDAWFAGFTKSHTIVVWLGNDDSSPMDKISGGGLPAEIWKEIVSEIK